MRKRVKKLNLNTTKRSHDQLLIKNLFQSLMLNGLITTTDLRAKSLKSYSSKKVTEFSKINDAYAKKKWMNENISSVKYRDRVEKNIDAVKNDFRVRMLKVGPRKGDSAMMYELSVLNFVKSKSDE